MSARALGVTLLNVVLLVTAMVGILLAQEETPAEPAAPTESMASVSGELAFSEPILFDYDRDGEQERVQFWIEFEARPAPGEPGPEVASGSLRYYVFDLESERRIDDWMLGFNMSMGGGFPRAGEEYPLTNVRITGRQAQFDLLDTRFTVVDGGGSWEEDTIEVRQNSGPRPGRFYGGDVRVTVPQPLDIEANRECNECHDDAAVTIAAGGGPHRELECAFCHTEHPPEADEAVFPACLDCHEGHSEAMTPASCVECHASHDATQFVQTVQVPDAYCSACHDDVAPTLRASQSLHIGVKCVLCHQQEHAAEPESCEHCHRGAHEREMKDEGVGCEDCHGPAHDLGS